MSDADELSAAYKAYLACLNRQDWANLGKFVASETAKWGKVIKEAGIKPD